MEILIGTSGWIYKHWNGTFYPQEVKEREKLTYFMENFKTVELNASFYRTPALSTFKKWHDEAKEGFVFTIKLSRFISHIKRLVLDDDEIRSVITYILQNVKELGEHLGAILIQLPPSLKSNNERLEKFLDFFTGEIKKLDYNPDIAIEFRHETWFNEDTYGILRKYNIAFVISDSTAWPTAHVFTAEHSYIRFHGPEKLFASLYSDEQMKWWADFILEHKEIKKFYVYFNNDEHGYAIVNSKKLIELTQQAG
ncbi:MAG: DUF72 domain-containing protein [Ignavibacteriae bacterium]|nr:MAG: DUF72 domain-containing protein [Ignavibacteriota bacterium]